MINLHLSKQIIDDNPRFIIYCLLKLDRIWILVVVLFRYKSKGIKLNFKLLILGRDLEKPVFEFKSWLTCSVIKSLVVRCMKLKIPKSRNFKRSQQQLHHKLVSLVITRCTVHLRPIKPQCLQPWVSLQSLNNRLHIMIIHIKLKDLLIPRPNWLKSIPLSDLLVILLPIHMHTLN